MQSPTPRAARADGCSSAWGLALLDCYFQPIQGRSGPQSAEISGHPHLTLVSCRSGSCSQVLPLVRLQHSHRELRERRADETSHKNWLPTGHLLLGRGPSAVGLLLRGVRCLLITANEEFNCPSAHGWLSRLLCGWGCLLALLWPTHVVG